MNVKIIIEKCRTIIICFNYLFSCSYFQKNLNKPCNFASSSDKLSSGEKLTEFSEKESFELSDSIVGESLLNTFNSSVFKDFDAKYIDSLICC